MHKDNISTLAYAKEDMFAYVLYFNQRFTERESKILQKTTVDLIDLALGLDGTYYLPYQLFYSPEQLRKAYPAVIATQIRMGAALLRAISARSQAVGQAFQRVLLPLLPFLRWRQRFSSIWECEGDEGIANRIITKVPAAQTVAVGRHTTIGNISAEGVDHKLPPFRDVGHGTCCRSTGIRNVGGSIKRE